MSDGFGSSIIGADLGPIRRCRYCDCTRPRSFHSFFSLRSAISNYRQENIAGSLRILFSSTDILLRGHQHQPETERDYSARRCARPVIGDAYTMTERRDQRIVSPSPSQILTSNKNTSNPSATRLLNSKPKNPNSKPTSQRSTPN